MQVRALGGMDSRLRGNDKGHASMTKDTRE